MSTQVLIHIDVRHAVDMGIRFFLSSRPSPFSAPPIPSLHNWHTSGRASSLASHSSVTGSNNFSSRTTHSDRQIQSPSLTNSPTAAATYKNRSTQILTPGNEFGFLPPECFTKVEVVRVKRKVLWSFDEEAGGAEQEQSDKKEEGAILDLDMNSTEDVAKRTTIDTRAGRGHMTEHVAPHLDQFFIDLPEDHRARVVHPDLKKEAWAIFST